MEAAFRDLGAITYFLNREDLREVEEIQYEGWGKVCELYHSVGCGRGKILSLNCPVEQLYAIQTS